MNKKDLLHLYRYEDINDIWHSGQNLAVIDHPSLGRITPNQYRARYHNKPCPFCGKKMVHGQLLHSTNSKKDALDRGYQYKDRNGKDVINQIKGIPSIYFHPHYVTLDHKLNKARFPDRMFDYDNLQIICWKCNSAKGDNNAYELQLNLEYVQDLARETFNRYPVL